MNNYIKVVCVNNVDWPRDFNKKQNYQNQIDLAVNSVSKVEGVKYGLEINKIYQAILVFDEKTENWKNNYLQIKGLEDNGWYPTNMFITLEEFRSKQLKELGI